MERLTDYHVDGSGAYMVCSGACIDDDFDCNNCKKLDEMVDRLAAYEDTGLEPEEIEEAKGRVDLKFALWVSKVWGLADGRLNDILKAEKDGRLVVLPAKPDETVYQRKKGDDIPSMFRLDGVTIDEDGEITYQTHWGEAFTPDDFGKTIFLTREEAEAELKKREADNETD